MGSKITSKKGDGEGNERKEVMEGVKGSKIIPVFKVIVKIFNC